MLFIDASERRSGTRLPQSIIEQAISLDGLEAATGADMLISPLKLPLKDVNPKLLQKHIDAGLLVQRKTGRDLSSSIPKLNDILFRMRQWTSRPYLLFVGVISRTRDGNAMIDNQDTGFSWNAVDGAIQFWQLRGGMYANVPNDSYISDWVNGWLNRLRELNQSDYKELQYRMPQQVLVKPDWTSFLINARVGIGEEKASVLKEWFPDLGDALCFLSDYDSLELQSLKGFGESHVRKTKQLLGLDDNEILVRQFKSDNAEAVADTCDCAANLQTLLKQIGTPDQCKKCKADIFWVITKNGKAAPITPQGLNHFADCPNANEFRKAKTT